MRKERRFVLFALTGLGNQVLERLVAADVAPDLLVTRAERGPYPYEPLPFIGDVAAALNVECKIDVEGEQDVAQRAASLLLAATYHRKIGADVRRHCAAAINLHPSLLPQNRGSNPMFWSIYNGDSVTGVTAHALTDNLDDGAICAQASLAIRDDETQTSLRRRLGALAGELAISVAQAHRAGALIFQPQAEAQATTFPRVGESHHQIDLRRSAEQIRRHVNALRDWPLARLGARTIQRVLRVMPLDEGAISASSLRQAADTIWAHAADAEILFQLDGAR
jgi:methionyl-tRNA formyltransferase